MARWVPLLAVGFAVAAASPATVAAGQRSPATIHDGPARFQVITPSLVRLEYAADESFENRPTLTVPSRAGSRPRFKTRVVDGLREIRTSRLTLRYQLGAGPFDPSNLRLRVGNKRRWARVGFPPPPAAPSGDDPPTVVAPNPDPDPEPRIAGNLGGWYRGLDSQSGPVALHDGLLSRDGWFLLDDTTSPALIEGGAWYEPRPGRSASYQDGYLFGYGDDYARGLRDFRTLAGPAPLLPRKAFGNWFSRYNGYSTSDYRKLLGEFRSHRVPLDVLVVDTDYKSPHDWNGWQWTPVFFPNPTGFLDWAHAKGLEVILNVHPSITTDDPSYPAADAAAGGLIGEDDRCRTFVRDPSVSCGVWDWARREHVGSYFSLHDPFERVGVDSWWLDWCCDESRADAPGLTGDAWINSLYAGRERAQGERWLPLSRVGSSFQDYTAAMPGIWAEHRNTIHFTGDTLATWEMLDFQTRFTAAEGAGIGLPYVSHDIGSYQGDRLPNAMYVRWIQLGAFQPILRLHSDHAPRLPWEYGGRAGAIAADFLRLRESLIPYLYTVARQAYDSGLPIVRAMYLGWPRAAAAYRFDRQYMLGDELLVAPIATPDNPARKRVWFPPGRWVDIFTGRGYHGPRATIVSTPLERMPVFARAGGIVPRQPYMEHVRSGAVDPLLLDVYAGANGSFTLYEDSGRGLAYQRGRFARTKFGWRQRAGSATLEIDRARGDFPGRAAARRYRLRIVGVGRPHRVTVAAAGARGKIRRSRYEAGARRLAIDTGRLPSRGGSVRIRFAPD